MLWPQICKTLIENYEENLLIDVEAISSMDFTNGKEYVSLCGYTAPLKLSGSKW